MRNFCALTVLALMVISAVYAKSPFIDEALQEAILRVDKGIKTTEDYNNNSTRETTTADLFHKARRPSGKTGQKSRSAEILERTMMELDRDGMCFHSLTQEEQNDILVAAGCNETITVATCDLDFDRRYRTADGTCNNVDHPSRGAASIAQIRLLTPKYDDYVSSPRVAGLPSARLVSTEAISTAENTPDTEYSGLLMQWGQFHDHDITFTPQVVVTTNLDNNVLCDETCENVSPCFPVEIPPKDPRINSATIPCMHIDRSAADCLSLSSVSDDIPYQRQQINQITTYVDASNMYGSSLEEEQAVRELNPNEGFLKIGSLSPAGKPYLPSDTASKCQQDPTGDEVPCFLSGDVRTNEQLGLTSMHIIFLREHNRIAAQLKQLNPGASGDQIYHETRKILGAEMQVITFEQWLHKILGTDGMNKMGNYTGYNPNVDATISNEFSTAAYRFGHGLVKPSIIRLDANLQEIAMGHVPLHLCFFAPHHIVHGGLDPILRGLFGSSGKELLPSEICTDEITERLFELADNIALDLAALNIHRGRDHGLPSYNDYRAMCGLSFAKKWQDFVEIPKEQQNKLKKVYKDVNQIDLWVGGMSETPIPGAKIGPTFQCILVEQYKRLRDGDRFWYQNEGIFTPEQRVQLEKASLSRIICDNGDSIDRIQPDPFRIATLNEMVPCANIVSMDLSSWTGFPDASTS